MIPTSVPEQHRAALRSVASKHSIAENEIARLYQAADEVLHTGSTKAANITVSRMTHPMNPAECPGHRVEAVTVINYSGVFVMVTCEMRKAAGPVLLRTGKLFSMEGADSVNSSLTTRMF